MNFVRPVGKAQRPRMRIGRARSKSSQTPAAPCACIAQSMTLHAMFGAATLIIAISACAFLLPTVSIMYAALSTSSRAWSIMIRALGDALQRHRLVGDRPPNATRDLARRHIFSSATSACPISRMQ
jgi:hypothetical protein